CYQYISGYSF
nr:immunoglobulin light chain junction region [Macaca mulatta]MOV93984.1 immunoglobulin light chain junction region [Macaca mulatta]MOW54403.1 immunoglobulin light chain junction region [Macaca mulatta]